LALYWPGKLVYHDGLIEVGNDSQATDVH
jgi:hypothetical protein